MQGPWNTSSWHPFWSHVISEFSFSFGFIPQISHCCHCSVSLLTSAFCFSLLFGSSFFLTARPWVVKSLCCWLGKVLFHFWAWMTILAEYWIVSWPVLLPQHLEHTVPLWSTFLSFPFFSFVFLPYFQSLRINFFCQLWRISGTFSNTMSSLSVLRPLGSDERCAGASPRHLSPTPFLSVLCCAVPQVLQVTGSLSATSHLILLTYLLCFKSYQLDFFISADFVWWLFQFCLFLFS